MNGKLKYLTLSLLILVSLLLVVGSVAAKRPDAWKGVGRKQSDLFTYVKRQDLYYDSIVTADPPI